MIALVTIASPLLTSRHIVGYSIWRQWVPRVKMWGILGKRNRNSGVLRSVELLPLPVQCGKRLPGSKCGRRRRIPWPCCALPPVVECPYTVGAEEGLQSSRWEVSILLFIPIDSESLCFKKYLFCGVSVPFEQGCLLSYPTKYRQ